MHKVPPLKGRLYDHRRPERHLPFGPSPQRLPDVPAISEEKHMLCLSRPLFWLKYCSKGLCQSLKTIGLILTQTRRSYDPLSRRLPYPRFASSGSTEEHLSDCYTLGNRRFHSSCLISTQVLILGVCNRLNNRNIEPPRGESFKDQMCLHESNLTTPTMSARQLASLLGTLESCRLAILQAPHHLDT